MSGIDEVTANRCSGCGEEYPPCYLEVAGDSHEGVLNLNEKDASQYGVVNSNIARSKGLDDYLKLVTAVKCTRCRTPFIDSGQIGYLVRRRMGELGLAE